MYLTIIFRFSYFIGMDTVCRTTEEFVRDHGLLRALHYFTLRGVAASVLNWSLIQYVLRLA